MANGLFAGGDGTPLNPYLIEDALDLDAVRNNMSASYKLVNNINLDIAPFNEGEGWNPIGQQTPISLPFKGDFDGSGLSIFGLYVNRPTSDYQGLFGDISSNASASLPNTVKNLKIINANVVGASSTGILAGRAYYTIISDIFTSGNVVGTSYTGGVLGTNNNNGKRHRKLSSEANVVGTSYVGGLCGGTNSVIIENSFAKGSVYGSSEVGGFIGSLGFNSSVINSYSTGLVTGKVNASKLGGFAGVIDRPNALTNNFWDINTSGQATSATGTGLTTAQMKTKSSYTSWDKELNPDGTQTWYLFDGYYPMFEDPFYYKVLVKHNGTFKVYFSNTWGNVSPSPTEQDYIKFGINLKDLPSISQTAWEKLNGDFELYFYTDNASYEKVSCVIETEPFSVYDYIGELPEVVIYTEDTEDVVVSISTEPFEIYDEFGDSVEVLFYTDDTDVTNADLILGANWSPIDELDGDFEVVSWTDEAPDTAQRALEMQAVPQPQFVKLLDPKRVYGALDSVYVSDVSESFRDEARYFVASDVPNKWYVWDRALKKFVVTDASTNKEILANGMTHADLNSITDKQWRSWAFEYINVGMFIIDNPRDTIKTIVETVSYEDYLPRHTSTIANSSLYILNTTAMIDISFDANVLKGILSDADLTRVQYRVLLNNRNFYPSDGSFTKLGESPQNIELVIQSKDIIIDDWNNIRVEFQDYFGTKDYWSTNFMGTYTGLMFKDVYGEYFSNEIGEVLKHLDFGVIIAGQTTLEHEVILKNQYGYDVKNVHLLANTVNFPTEMTVEFSQNQSPFIPHPDLKLSGVLANNAEMSFFIRLNTKLGSTPDANGSFDIIVRADKA